MNKQKNLSIKRIKGAGSILMAFAILGGGLISPMQALGASSEPQRLISKGPSHALAVNNGEVYTWGRNVEGQLGDGTTTNKSKPTKITGITNVKGVEAGGYYSLSLKNDGTVWGWGKNDKGQVGNGTFTNQTKPVQVYGLTNVISVGAGVDTSLALKSDGSVWGWGNNGYGQLGDGTTQNSNIPVQVKGLNNMVAVDAGYDFSVALKSDGTVWTWGSNIYGQLGTGKQSGELSYSRVPLQVPNLTDVVSIEAGQDFVLALTSDGSVWSWGYNGFGQLGRNESGIDTTYPKKVRYVSDAIKISAGANSGYAILADGSVMSWGANMSGQLGNGTTNDNWGATTIAGMNNVSMMSADLVVKADNSVWSWGNNANGQVGDGTTGTANNRTRPILISTLTINVPDTTAPTILLTIPSNEATNKDVSVGFTVTDSSGVQQVKWAVGNQPISYFASNGQILTGSSLGISENGIYTIYAKDQKGNESVKTFTINNIDKIAPTSPVITLIGSQLSVESGVDGESGVRESYVNVNNGGWIAFTSALTLVDGEYDIQAKTVDKAGNESAVVSAHYSIFDNALQTASDEVTKAEQQKTQEQVDKAKDLVDALPASPEKDDLLDRLKDVQDQIDAEKALDNATNEVIKAEQQKTQEQVDKAKDLVDALPASPEKDDLLDRLKDVQDQIDADKALETATNEVIKAEKEKTQEQVDKAKDLVVALPASPEKENLLDRLKDVQDQINADKVLRDATQKVVVAETTRQQSDIDTARNAVNALPDSASKKELLDRLDAIVPDTGETTPPTEEDDIIPNKDLPGEIGKLTDPADKKTFSDILKAIERAEANPTNRVLVQLAWDKVKAVPDSVKNNMQNKKVYKSLYARAEKLKNDFNAGLEQEALQVAIKKATDYVVSYEKYKLTAYKTKAQEAVNALPDGDTKTALQARIDAVVMKTA